MLQCGQTLKTLSERGHKDHILCDSMYMKYLEEAIEYMIEFDDGLYVLRQRKTNEE